MSELLYEAARIKGEVRTAALASLPTAERAIHEVERCELEIKQAIKKLDSGIKIVDDLPLADAYESLPLLSAR